MGIWDCWISCQKVCHLHRGCNGSAASAGACPHMASNTCSNGHSNTLLGCLRNAENLLAGSRLNFHCHEHAISLQYVIKCYQMLPPLGICNPRSHRPIFSAATGRGPWILMTWMMQKRPWARSWWICVSRSELLLD